MSGIPVHFSNLGKGINAKYITTSHNNNTTSIVSASKKNPVEYNQNQNSKLLSPIPENPVPSSITSNQVNIPTNLITDTNENTKYTYSIKCNEKTTIDDLIEKNYIPAKKTTGYSITCNPVNLYFDSNNIKGKGNDNYVYDLLTYNKNDTEMVLRKNNDLDLKNIEFFIQENEKLLENQNISNMKTINKNLDFYNRSIEELNNDMKTLKTKELSGYFVQAYLSKSTTEGGKGCENICKVYQFGTYYNDEKAYAILEKLVDFSNFMNYCIYQTQEVFNYITLFKTHTNFFKVIIDILINVLNGLICTHSINCAHLDIKMDNIGLTNLNEHISILKKQYKIRKYTLKHQENPIVAKLMDFGHMKYIKTNVIKSDYIFDEKDIGKTHYPPEAWAFNHLTNKAYNYLTIESDIYMFGDMLNRLYDLYILKIPEFENNEILKQKIIEIINNCMYPTKIDENGEKEHGIIVNNFVKSELFANDNQILGIDQWATYHEEIQKRKSIPELIKDLTNLKNEIIHNNNTKHGGTKRRSRRKTIKKRNQKKKSRRKVRTFGRKSV